MTCAFDASEGLLLLDDWYGGGGDSGIGRLDEFVKGTPKRDGDPERISGITGDRRDSFENVAEGETDANATEEMVVGSRAAGIGGGGI
jgi:hypothetical protein